MKVKIVNKINSIPIFFNAIWLILLCYIYFHQVPEYENYKTHGASVLIFGSVGVSFFIFFISLIYILIANLYMKHKVYVDMFYVIIPVIFLFLMLFFR